MFRCSGSWHIPPAFHGNPFVQGGDGTHIYFIYDSLFFFIPKTKTLVPRLGLALSEAPDLNSLIIKIRQGLTWHDGKPFTSADIKSSFLTLYLQGWGGNLNKIRLIDRHTVAFDWKQPMTLIEKRNILLEKIKAPNHLYAPWVQKAEHILKKARTINAIAYQKWTDREHAINRAIQLEKTEALQAMYTFRPKIPVGTGAFKMSVVGASEMEMVKAPHSWCAEKVSVDKIKLLKGPSNDILWAFLIAGDVDASHPATPADVAEQILKLNPKSHIVTPSDYGDFGFVFNTKKQPLTDIHFRKAIAHLINKDTIRMVSSFYSKTSDPYNLPMLESLKNKWFAPNMLVGFTAYDYSPPKAVAMLEKSGYKKDLTGFYQTPSGEAIKLEIASIAGYSDWVLASESFATQLTKAGIKANVRTLEGSYFHQQLQNNQFDIASNFGADFKMYAHPATSYSRFFDKNGYIKKASGLPDQVRGPDGFMMNLQQQVDLIVGAVGEGLKPTPTAPALKNLSWVANEYVPFLSVYEKNLTVFVVEGERISGWPHANDPVWSSSSSGLENLYGFLIATGTVHRIR